MKKRVIILLSQILLCVSVSAQGVWCADLGCGEYQNPILYADYSDPDVIRVGEDYWMTASSFNCIPGLPILHSTDLVNWEIVGHALKSQKPLEHFNNPAHGDGVWAPSIRHHDGWFYIYWGDPDQGIFMTRTQDPRGEWSEPLLVKAGKGIIDTCPLWDDDGRAYLVNGWAGSRAGFKSILTVAEMSPDGESLLSDFVMVFDGHSEHPTVEGPKFYKRNGWYYIFAPAGGVKPGWQIVLRSRSVFGPYECRKVLHQGNSSIPGPHQGGWVEDTEGDSWFMHFVDMYAYGRVVHLQPMRWLDDDWCEMGVDQNGDGIGEPVLKFRKPAGRSLVKTPANSDDFSSRRLSLQWQWHANPQTGWAFTNPTTGELRLYCQKLSTPHNLWSAPNLLLQKIDAPTYKATTKVRFSGSYDGDRAGIVVMGMDYATLGFEQRDGKLYLVQNINRDAHKGGKEQVQELVELSKDELWLRCEITKNQNSDSTPRMECQFLYSLDGKRFKSIGSQFVAREGRWIGAKIGFYSTAEIKKNDGGWIDVDEFVVTK